MNEHLEFAIGLAREAGKLMKQNFSVGMKMEWKADETPLTVTDTAINTLVLSAIQEKYPTHSFIGEEGSRVIESEYTWVCDPIDGTMPFSHGYPTFAFSLALVKNGESILGVIYDPLCDRLVSAEKGKGTFLNGERVSVSKVSEINRRSFISLHGEQERLSAVRKQLVAKGCRTPKLYSTVYSAMLVATGDFAAEIFGYRNPWDAAAVKIIVEEAGGKVTNLLGEEQRYDQPINGFVASNGVVHQQLLDMIRPYVS